VGCGGPSLRIRDVVVGGETWSNPTPHSLLLWTRVVFFLSHLAQLLDEFLTRF
jgi:hypothetical protein